ncbi:MAG: hypothetical protein JSU69_10825 [Candidatus Zixiibacteriota bacterium]|nr:MAG: hypothetical protein JSU69_10825 [candidate division Zixibacteria bacterium]
MTNLSRLVFAIAISPIIFAGIVRADDPGLFRARVGLGYDFVSQEYFTSDTTQTPSPDQMLEATLLRKDYLDDKKGLVYLTFDPQRNGQYILEAGWEQTPDVYRGLGWGHVSVGGQDSRLDADVNLEIKERYRGETEVGEDVSVIKARTGYRRRLSQSLETRIRILAERVDFDSAGSLVYDYARFAGEVGLSVLSRDFNSALFSIGIEKRNVPDSNWLDYLSVRAGLGYFGSLSQVFVSADLTIENKDFSAPEDRDDYILITLLANLRIPAGEAFYLKPDLSLEYFDFEIDNFINDDYLLARGGLLFGWDLEHLSASLGPRIELLSIETSLEGDDDYSEMLAQAGADLMYSDKAFILLENQLGKRNYRHKTEYYSNFIFDRMSLIGTLKVFRSLSFDLLFSAEWEWHEIDSDDSRLYLLSAGLNYSF